MPYYFQNFVLDIFYNEKLYQDCIQVYDKNDKIFYMTTDVLDSKLLDAIRSDDFGVYEDNGKIIVSSNRGGKYKDAEAYQQSEDDEPTFFSLEMKHETTDKEKNDLVERVERLENLLERLCRKLDVEIELD